MRVRVWLQRFVGVLLSGFMLLLIVIGTQVVIGWRCNLQREIPSSGPALREGQAVTASIQDYARPESEAYLSYPEWLIVWSHQENADFQEHHLAGEIAYFAELRQFWGSFCCISRLIRERDSLNGANFGMLTLMGASFSAEYVIKGAYERTIGRLSEWSSGHQPVEEDEFAASVAHEYAGFIHTRPFYEFRFAHHIPDLWQQTPIWGLHPFRKFERKFFLTGDFACEAFYGWVIEHVVRTANGHETAETYAWVKNADRAVLENVPHVRIVRQLGPQSFIVAIPRYQEFTDIAFALARRGVQFLDIAGNSQILVSVIAPQNWRYDRADARELFSNPILTRTGLQRVALGCSVSALHDVLPRLNSGGATLEHVYDY